MFGWNFDIARTQKRYRSLERYYQQKGLNPDNFSCVHYAVCAGSQKSGTINQYAGGTTGLPPLYDVSYSGRPIRVLIVGKEAAHRPYLEYGVASNFHARSQQIVNTIYSEKRTNHIKGTLITLQRIFEVESDYVYACYSLGNVLRCGFQKEEIAENTSGLTDTRTMRHNCTPYLIDEIKILEPTLIITQGAWAVDTKPPLLDYMVQNFGPSKRLMTNTTNGKYGLYEFPAFMMVTSHHPARLNWWKTRYAPDSLWPMLDHLKAIGYLPRISPDHADTFEQLIKSTGTVTVDS